ncbi:BNR repeat protein [Mycoplasma testudineum]|uniref:exo-alpha-sialidase n=1 Tax=Mycoplasma testudineum TaxID=244584 RepID=A0A4R6IH24_9MOLU|nr:exo-alpha-sialidase [Mycoplasma testudineum]OYD27184.1 hypothetical protein CG473_00900 [Mycoplasma testudineum]TDO21057.1 BNR repeat protein [Mycoplasma testudineum]
MKLNDFEILKQNIKNLIDNDNFSLKNKYSVYRNIENLILTHYKEHNDFLETLENFINLREELKAGLKILINNLQILGIDCKRSNIGIVLELKTYIDEIKSEQLIFFDIYINKGHTVNKDISNLGIEISELEENIIFKKDENFKGGFRIPSMSLLKDGQILFNCDRRFLNNLDAPYTNIDQVYKLKNNNGKISDLKTFIKINSYSDDKPQSIIDLSLTNEVDGYIYFMADFFPGGAGIFSKTLNYFVTSENQNFGFYKEYLIVEDLENENYIFMKMVSSQKGHFTYQGFTDKNKKINFQNLNSEKLNLIKINLFLIFQFDNIESKFKGNFYIKNDSNEFIDLNISFFSGANFSKNDSGLRYRALSTNYLSFFKFNIQTSQIEFICFINPWLENYKNIGANLVLNGPGKALKLKYQNGNSKNRLIFKAYFTNDASSLGAITIYSDDYGNTWQTSEFIGGPKSRITEFDVTELQNGVLVAILRRMGSNTLSLSKSIDGGKTWNSISGNTDEVGISSIILNEYNSSVLQGIANFTYLNSHYLLITSGSNGRNEGKIWMIKDFELNSITEIYSLNSQTFGYSLIDVIKIEQNLFMINVVYEQNFSNGELIYKKIRLKFK